MRGGDTDGGAIRLDTSDLISLADPVRAHHETAVSYLREALRRGVPLYLSAIAASELQVKQALADLPLRNVEVLAFNIDHTMTAGLQMRGFQSEPGDGRALVRADLKRIAQAVCEPLTHGLTEDTQALVKFVHCPNEAGQCK